MEISFPRNMKHKYWKSHFSFVLSLFNNYGANIKYHNTANKMTIIIDGKKCLIDYSDFSELEYDVFGYKAVFKMHYDMNKKYPSNVFPFTPISFMDWGQRGNIMKTYKYNAKGSLSYRQISYGGAKVRREQVFYILNEFSKKNKTPFEYNIMGHGEYLCEVSNTLVAVFVGGATNNMLDRGHLQYLGMGCCTISANIPELLPWNTHFIPSFDYIECKNDYSNLPELIGKCIDRPDLCLKIGANALKTFSKSCTPERAISWIEECLK